MGGSKKTRIMKKLFSLFALIVALCFVITGCHETTKKAETNDSIVAEPSTPDSTIYGVCGDGTAMHTLELITDAGDTLQYMFGEGDDSPVVGGLLAGDRLAVVEGPDVDGDKTADKIINLTTLIGKWTSLDKNFEIEEGGVVKSNVEAERKPWTSWKILNGQLLLNRDTFDIDNLGSDTLALENRNGIFVYKRVR